MNHYSIEGRAVDERGKWRICPLIDPTKLRLTSRHHEREREALEAVAAAAGHGLRPGPE
jgi:hypothetical protein